MKKTFNRIKMGALAVITLALTVASFATVPTYAANCDTSNPDLGVGVNCGKGNGTPNNLFGDSNSIVNTVINTMLFIVGILSVIMIIFSGIRYATAHGDKSQVESAKNTLIYSIVGLVVAIIAYAVVNWVVGLWS